MASFVLRIKLGNDAMRTADHVSRALAKVAARLRGRLWEDWTEAVMDDNGNKAGEWTLEGAEIDDEDPS